MQFPSLGQMNNLRNTKLDRSQVVGGLRTIFNGNLSIPILLLMLLGMMTLPLPAFLLDVFFSFNIALSIVVLLVGVYSLRPLEFAVFPTILLIATLLRLALNVASTRVVLLEGHAGGDAAGKVIQAFGEVVIGGNYAVGLVVFIILMIINFVVVTKGAGRISEVSARFTLDAMPGKQMAIDADLNAGLINQDEARLRREEVASEADFYGAMDGASKFVRGDAVAGILILFLNIIGGLAIGMIQHQLTFADALQRYILLTIGDGLVAQIPSLLLSTAAAIMVTRVNSTEDMRSQVVNQMFDSPKALGVSAGILLLMGSIPGMPHVAFLGLGSVCGGLAYLIHRRKTAVVEVSAAEDPGRRRGAVPAALPGATAGGEIIEAKPEQVELSWDDVQPVDMIGLEVGYRLIPLVNKPQGGELLGRIKGIRKRISQEKGFLVPSVHIRDNLDLAPSAYRILLMGVSVGEGEVFPDRDLAINPGQVLGEIDGVAGFDPAFGLPAVWIERNRKDQAQSLGYTVVDTSTVIATHLNQVLQKHIYELIGHEEIQKLLDQLAKSSPKLVAELVPDKLSINSVLKVCQNLLKEHIGIRDFRSICEALLAASENTVDTEQLTAAARVALSRQIVYGLAKGKDPLPVLTLQPDLEQLLLKAHAQAQKSGADETGFLEPGLIDAMQNSMRELIQRQEIANKPAVLLVAGNIRRLIGKMVRAMGLDASVLAYAEIPESKAINVDGAVSGSRAPA
ncbi:flagellar biosynthesis protein FlhA [Halioxenophilus sp. WMMB6]|uniref:flagellar biosynthesis protein FlhA n=1 Tax=Halioxenophilus sp. WMMB6 TaxID=3073815 RepID=UPI00295E4B29|nr:flagellar biosynthesis protein FlhA [Halioxenophilus sp. WMMB6]